MPHWATQLGVILVASSSDIYTRIGRAYVGMYLGLLLVILGAKGTSPVGALRFIQSLVESPSSRLATCSFWVLLTLPLLRAILDCPVKRSLRCQPVPRGVFMAIGVFQSLPIHAPALWLVAFGLGVPAGAYLLVGLLLAQFSLLLVNRRPVLAAPSLVSCALAAVWGANLALTIVLVTLLGITLQRYRQQSFRGPTRAFLASKTRSTGLARALGLCALRGQPAELARAMSIGCLCAVLFYFIVVHGTANTSLLDWRVIRAALGCPIVCTTRPIALAMARVWHSSLDLQNSLGVSRHHQGKALLASTAVLLAILSVGLTGMLWVPMQADFVTALQLWIVVALLLLSTGIAQLAMLAREEMLGASKPTRRLGLALALGVGVSCAGAHRIAWVVCILALLVYGILMVLRLNTRASIE